ncbi:hypothetical protein OSB04_004455 [Centaurea solstitialis]|uniref:Uncharacterized protein n=1 Tax=Centaurea solstitialis TaxID=347529 RepID=A0AA38WVL8_9ASTR|nr:hypothetical protein OSB04_004455 [Centaurea solstitialis]
MDKNFSIIFSSAAINFDDEDNIIVSALRYVITSGDTTAGTGTQSVAVEKCYGFSRQRRRRRPAASAECGFMFTAAAEDGGGERRRKRGKKEFPSKMEAAGKMGLYILGEDGGRR